MLEKLEGNAHMSKLKAILLLEADFNALNKIVFNCQALPAIEASKAILLEVIGGRRG